MSATAPVYIIVVFSLFALNGCSTVNYYRQAVAGQWMLIDHRQPIETVRDDPATAPALRERLARIETIRAFARESLGLPVDAAYSTYVDLGRDYVVWNVVAAPADSLQLKTWCYPVVGCQTYRGYFDRVQAEALAQTLAAKGMDTWAPGVIAYSSLGWFDDPVLNTFAHWPEDRLAALIFHELSHKTVYISGDTTFNESYATTVELEGLLRYLQVRDQPGNLSGVLERQRMEAEFTAMVMATARQLDALYKRHLPVQTMLRRKADLIAELRARHASQRQGWPDPFAYDHFFGAGLNNARIASVGTYNRWVPAFRQLLREEENNFIRFHEAVGQLSRLPPDERERQLDALEHRAAGAPDRRTGETHFR